MDRRLFLGLSLSAFLTACSQSQTNKPLNKSYHVRAIAHHKSALISIWGKKMNHGRSTGHDINPDLIAIAL